MPQLLDQQRRGVPHVRETAEFLAPVSARTVHRRSGHRALLHRQDVLAGLEVVLEACRAAQLVGALGQLREKGGVCAHLRAPPRSDGRYRGTRVRTCPASLRRPFGAGGSLLREDAEADDGQADPDGREQRRHRQLGARGPRRGRLDRVGDERRAGDVEPMRTRTGGCAPQPRPGRAGSPPAARCARRATVRRPARRRSPAAGSGSARCRPECRRSRRPGSCERHARGWPIRSSRSY